MAAIPEVEGRRYDKTKFKLFFIKYDERLSTLMNDLWF